MEKLGLKIVSRGKAEKKPAQQLHSRDQAPHSWVFTVFFFTPFFIYFLFFYLPYFPYNPFLCLLLQRGGIEWSYFWLKGSEAATAVWLKGFSSSRTFFFFSWVTTQNFHIAGRDRGGPEVAQHTPLSNGNCKLQPERSTHEVIPLQDQCIALGA